MFTDSHCHLTCDELWPEAEQLIENASDFSDLLVICTNRKEFERALELKERHPDRIRVAFGYYPGDAKEITPEDLAYLEEQLQKGTVDVLGEIGLDYYWDKSFKEEQIELFKKQMELANRYGKPISIHMREAARDTVDLLRDFARTKIILHCYSGSVETLRELLKLDTLVSYAGPITFKNNRKGVESVAATPIDRILSETDAPYLSPVPLRGKRNEPSNARYTAAKIAEIKGVGLDELNEQISRNYHSLFETGKERNPDGQKESQL